MHNLLVKDIFIRKNRSFTWEKYTFYSGVATNRLSMQYIFPMEQSLLKQGECCVHNLTFPGNLSCCVAVMLYRSTLGVQRRIHVTKLNSTIDGYMHWSKNFIDRGGSRIPLGGGANPPWEGANIQIFPKTA